MRPTPLLLLALVLALPACSDDDEQESLRPECVVGDLSQPPEIELVYRAADGQMMPLADGGEAPLILPPQGGKVFIVGIRARNVDICGLRINAALRDQCSGRILGRDGRPIFLVAGDDGWAIPRQPRELSDYANIPACPNFASDRDVDKQPYALEIAISDGQMRTASKEITVTPTCAEAKWFDQCTCECDADYRLGAGCPLQHEKPADRGDPAGVCAPQVIRPETEAE